MVPKQAKDLTMVENYRPISLLEVPGKAFEKIIEIEAVGAELQGKWESIWCGW